MPSSAVAPLIARQLAGGYGAEAVVRGVDLCLERGEMTALLGRNGCGKSTLLRLLAGALPPQGGAVLLEGKPLGVWPRRARAQRLAVVPQELHVPFAF
jgi:iron complex transport system ATP-binding protein